ncbi:MAG: arylesterase [Hyphomicrobiaceae bacterium]|nr:MAG: arylesterase [Hyphomicrobiaceae bacterium]
MGWLRCLVTGLLAVAVMSAGASAENPQKPVKIVALGDSLTAGFRLRPSEAFPVQLAAALRKKGIEVEIVNAGVSGDTSRAGLERLDWAVPEGTEAVIIELGANDALRGVDPAETRRSLDAIMRRLKSRGIEMLLAGMEAPRNLGPEYGRAFNAIYPELAQAHGSLLYPFFLKGVALDPKLNLPDGLHPTAEGVARIVERIMPDVIELVARARRRRHS